MNKWSNINLFSLEMKEKRPHPMKSGSGVNRTLSAALTGSPQMFGTSLLPDVTAHSGAHHSVCLSTHQGH